VKPAAAHRFRRGLRIVVIPLHDDVAADADLADVSAIVRHLVAGVVEDARIPGRDELDPLPRLDDAALSSAAPACSGLGSHTVMNGASR
jgi:hypothetical protein